MDQSATIKHPNSPRTTCITSAKKAAKASRTLVSTPNQKAVNTMVKNSRAWADGGYQVVGQSSVAIDDKE